MSVTLSTTIIHQKGMLLKDYYNTTYIRFFRERDFLCRITMFCTFQF